MSNGLRIVLHAVESPQLKCSSQDLEGAFGMVNSHILDLLANLLEIIAALCTLWELWKRRDGQG